MKTTGGKINLTKIRIVHNMIFYTPSVGQYYHRVHRRDYTLPQSKFIKSLDSNIYSIIIVFGLPSQYWHKICFNFCFNTHRQLFSRNHRTSYMCFSGDGSVRIANQWVSTSRRILKQCCPQPF